MGGGKSLAHFKLEWMYLTKKNVGQDFASPNLEQHRKDEIWAGKKMIQVVANYE